jgi:nitroreductase
MPEILSYKKLIYQRFSCRTYSEEPISDEKRIKLHEFMRMLEPGPFGNIPDFHLIAAKQGDSQALKDLGTYGFIQGATGFIIGTCNSGNKELEDFGYQMEKIILFATSLNLGTCWLGGSFTRSTFAKKINAPKDTIIPAVTSIGEMIDSEQARKGLIRRQINADKRLPWENLFFMDNFDHPLTQEIAQEWTEPLEMVRIGPSASNKQPWRIVQAGNNFHFFLQRTRGYRESALTRFLGVADIQHLDMGIAMCHFEQSLKELGLPGKWILKDPNILNKDELTEYIVTWEQ